MQEVQYTKIQTTWVPARDMVQLLFSFLHTHAYTHTCTYTHKCAYTRAHTHAHTHMCTSKHTLNLLSLSSISCWFDNFSSSAALLSISRACCCFSSSIVPSLSSSFCSNSLVDSFNLSYLFALLIAVSYSYRFVNHFTKLPTDATHIYK